MRRRVQNSCPLFRPMLEHNPKSQQCVLACCLWIPAATAWFLPSWGMSFAGTKARESGSRSHRFQLPLQIRRSQLLHRFHCFDRVIERATAYAFAIHNTPPRTGVHADRDTSRDLRSFSACCNRSPLARFRPCALARTCLYFEYARRFRNHRAVHARLPGFVYVRWPGRPFSISPAAVGSRGSYPWLLVPSVLLAVTHDGSVQLAGQLCQLDLRGR